MNDDKLERVFMDIKEMYWNYDNLEFIFKLRGNYLWVKSNGKIVEGIGKFSLRNLDKLLKMLKNNHMEFDRFEIQY